METVNKPRALPIFRMGDTDFFVDVRLDEFREVEAPWNRISMDQLNGQNEQVEIAFDKHTKNIYEGIIDPANVPAHVALVIIPPLTTLDPVGVARKFGLADNHFIKTPPIKIVKQRKRRGI